MQLLPKKHIPQCSRTALEIPGRPVCTYIYRWCLIRSILCVCMWERNEDGSMAPQEIMRFFANCSLSDDVKFETLPNHVRKTEFHQIDGTHLFTDEIKLIIAGRCVQSKQKFHRAGHHVTVILLSPTITTHSDLSFLSHITARITLLLLYKNKRAKLLRHTFEDGIAKKLAFCFLINFCRQQGWQRTTDGKLSDFFANVLCFALYNLGRNL